MPNNEYWTLTKLAALFVGQTRYTVGKALKELEMRSPDGTPTFWAHSLGLVQRTEGPQPWINVWLWHRERTVPFLEKYGMKRKDQAKKESEVTS